MRLRVRNSQDLLAGLLFAAFGAAALLLGHDYEMGEARRMGPGWFPLVLGGVLMAIGAATAARGLATEGEPVRDFALRPFLVIVGVVIFGLTVDRLGLAIATAGLVIVGSLGGREFRWVEAILLAILLTVLAIAIFVLGLGLPMPILP